MSRRFANLALLLLCVAFLFVTGAFGQGISGEILGTVTDSTRAVVPGATVVVSNTGTGEVRNAQTDDGGNYTFTSLVPGTYTVKVTKAGFKTGLLSDVQLLVKQQREVDVSLTVGSEATVLNVAAAAAALDTQSADLGQVITDKAIAELPLNGRQYMALAYFSAGVVSITGQIAEASGVAGTSGGRLNLSVSVSGNREQDITYTYDGIESKSYWLGAATLSPPPDAIEEFKVQKNFFSPEFGPPAVMNVVTKSGEHAFHGSAWEFARNSVLDARNYFETTQPQFQQNQFGIALGGAIPKTRKHFWFAYYEGLRIREPLPLFGFVPSGQQLQGNFSDLVPFTNGGGCPYDPGNTSGNCLPTTTSTIIDPVTLQPFPGNVIPAARINSFAKAMVPFFSPPNQTSTPLGNYRITPTAVHNYDQWAVHTTHQLSASDTVNARFSYDNDLTTSPGLFQFSGTESPIDTRNIAVGWTHIVRPTLINEFHAGYNHIYFGGGQPVPGFNPVKDLGFQNVTAVPQCLAAPLITISQSSGYPSLGGEICVGALDRDFLFNDNVAWVRGKHSITFGTDLRRISHRVRDDLFEGGLFYYLNALSGNNTADFMLGTPSFYLHSAGTSQGTHDAFWTAWYVNDDYRVTSKLVLNYGLRYENKGVPSPEEHNDSYFDPGTGLLLHPPQDGLPPGIANRVNTNFAPRIGLAYQPTPNFVVRSGYGIYYTNDPADELSFNTSSPPTYSQITSLPSGNTPWVPVTVGEGLPSDLFPPFDPSTVPADGTAAGNVSLFTRERNKPTPYVQQWNLSLQRILPAGVLFEAAYIGNHGVHLSRRVDTNTAVPLTGPPCDTSPVPGCDPRTIQERRPYPNWSSLMTDYNTAGSKYNALQVKIDKSYSRGLSLIAGYTFSKALSEDDYDALGTRNYSWLLIKNDYSRATYDRRQRLAFGMTYDLPFAKHAAGVTHQLLGGWTVTTIQSFTTGAPFGVTTSNDYAQIGLVYGFARPDRICNGNLPKSQRTLDRYFDTSCFVAPVSPFPHLGNSGYDILDAAGIINVDFGLLKNFGVERFHGQFRAELFNALNHPNFGEPGNNIDAPNYGIVTSAADPREIQLAIKFLW